MREGLLPNSIAGHGKAAPHVDNAPSKKVIYAALVGNLLVAATKFVAAAMTGSSSMLSEAVHSLVDTGQRGASSLRLFAIKPKTRRVDPLGYGPRDLLLELHRLAAAFRDRRRCLVLRRRHTKWVRLTGR
jgi:Co/Zn/Cd efflux system component